MSERLNEFEDVSSEFESENSGFEVNEARINEEHARQERTPLQKLLDAEVMVEIPDFPYSKTTPTIYELENTEIKVEKSQNEENRHTLFVASRTDTYDLYSVGFPTIDDSERLERLRQNKDTYDRDIERAENAYQSTVSMSSNYSEGGRLTSMSAALDRNSQSRSSALDRWIKNNEYAYQIPDIRNDKLKFNIVNPNDGSRFSTSFDITCNRDSEYLHLPVKKWNLELFKDKEITTFVIENIEDTIESKDIWTQFLDSNKRALPLQAYILLATKAQSLGGKIE